MNNITNILLDFWDDTLDFIDYHRTMMIISSIVLIVILLGVVAFYFIIDPVKVTIQGNDASIYGTKARKLEYQATAYNRSSSDYHLEWEVSAGKLTDKGDGTMIWELPTDEGTYTIKAYYENSSDVRNVTVIGNELSELYKKSAYQILFQDTDGDGLTDIYEASNSKTSQTNKDTDSDGLYDGDEIILGLDPLSDDSKGDGLKDGERKLSYTYKLDNITIKMEGKGNFTQTSVDKYLTETLGSVAPVIDGIYALYTEVELTSANITIDYGTKVLEGKDIVEDNLAVYELNEDLNTFKKLNTTIDKEKHTATFKTETLGKYFIADTSNLTSNLTTELVFVIDNSGSMYSSEEVEGSEQNDVNFQRVDVVNNLIDKLQGNYKFGAGKFTFEYTELVSLSLDKTAVKNKINTIKTAPESFSGTYIGAALEGGLIQFGSEDTTNRKYIVLLSDGKDTANVTGYDNKKLEEQIKIAVNKGVKVYTVGLGQVIDEKILTNIATSTKGKYYFASTADDLSIVFDQISADLNYNLYDSDNDSVDDSVIIADSGFLVGRDGFSFSNFSNTQVEYGYSYGMVLYAKLFYEGDLPKALGAKKITVNNVEIVSPAADPARIGITKGNATTLRNYIPISLELLSNLPVDFWSNISNGTLTIKNDYKKQMTSLGFTSYTAPYGSDLAKFKKYESLRFDMTSYLTSDSSSNESPLKAEDVELLKTLARFDITKYKDEKFNFYDNNDTAFNELKALLKKGEPVMIRINDDYTVLAVKLLADSKNMNKYKIEVYDPNYTGIPKYIEAERYKFSDIAEISKVVTDRYEYKFSYQGTQVGICLSKQNVVENI